MPVSEDEFERPVVNSQPTMSKAEQRKNNKPIMEKRRRARINHCLNELKTLILDAMKKDLLLRNIEKYLGPYFEYACAKMQNSVVSKMLGVHCIRNMESEARHGPARHSKLEKADILEMTVKHLQQIQRQHLATAVATDPAVIMRFKSGFDECAAEVSRYIGRMGNVDDGVKQRLIAHLHRCVNSLQQVSTFPQQNIYTSQTCDKSAVVLPSVSSIPGDVNNNSNQTERIHIPGGLQLIPSRLPTGELALLVPNSNQMSFLNAPPPPGNLQFQSILSPTFGSSLNKGPSAFTAVSKNFDNSSIEPKTSDSYSVGVSYRGGFDRRNCDDESHKDYGKFKRFVQAPAETSDRVPVVSSSFQRKAADSTTSLPAREEEKFTSFQPFQVDIPNTQFKAHISIPGYLHDTTKIQQKPNPNFTINPNKGKSPQKYTRVQSVSDNNALSGKFGLGLEKFSKIEPLSIITDNRDYSPRMTEIFQRIQSNPKYVGNESPTRTGKRPLSAGSLSHSPTSTESPGKLSRISLNFTVTDDYGKDAMSDQCNDRCQRISVIVEDVSKDGRREGNENGSQHSDMWRPW